MASQSESQKPLLLEAKAQTTDSELVKKAVSEMKSASDSGTLNQEQANAIARNIYELNERAKVGNVKPFAQGEESRQSYLIEKLTKSGYDYKEQPATSNAKKQGVAVKVTAPQSTANSDVKESEPNESFFAKHKLIIVGGSLVFISVAAGIYLYTTHKKV